MAVWIAATDVAAYLSLLVDDRVEEVTEAAATWVERQRPDLADAFADGTVGPDVVLGTKIYAAMLYQQRSSPSGMPYADELGAYTDMGPSLMNVYRLIGSRKPVAR